MCLSQSQGRLQCYFRISSGTNEFSRSSVEFSKLLHPTKEYAAGRIIGAELQAGEDRVQEPKLTELSISSKPSKLIHPAI